jgi:hypothetical protein
MTTDLQIELAAALDKLNQQQQYPSHKVIITGNEINHNHGVGILLHRLYPDSRNIYSIRSMDIYDGVHYFGGQNFCLHRKQSTYHQVLSAVQSNLGQIRPSAVLLIPYFQADFLLGLAIKRLYNSPLCVFIMDDQNIFSHHVDDTLVQQLLDSADLCFGISRPLCDAYQNKFHKKFWFFPPVIESKLIQCDLPQAFLDMEGFEPRGVLIGNIWCQRWLDQLRPLCRESQVKLDWYGNPNRSWIDFQEVELEKDGIFFRGFIEEDKLILALQKASFAVIPTGSSDHPDDRPELMNLSLPSRSCFMTATANIPLLILGHEQSAIARFVESAGLGIVCPYDNDAFVNAIRAICSIENQRKFRENSILVARQLGADGLGEWLWESLAKQRPVDLRFENLWPHGVKQYQSVLVTTCEINNRHGTGVLLKRVFPREENIVSVRTNDFYLGEQEWAGKSHLVSDLISDGRTAFGHVASIFLDQSSIERLFCVPYDSQTLLFSMAIKEFYKIPLAIWIMDDQNIVAQNVPDELMREFLSKADVRFATHPEMRDAYEYKYGFKFWLLPAVVPDYLITTASRERAQTLGKQLRGALVGSIWSQQWFNNICHTLHNTDIELDWYGNSDYFWLEEPQSVLQQKGLYPKGICSEDVLSDKLKNYPFVVVPTGTLDERDDQIHLSKLSLPGRILFILATSNTPIILLGDPSTSAANFVTTFQVGIVCDYTPKAFKNAVDYVLDLSNQCNFRQNAINVAYQFSDKGIDDWIWKSLEMRQAADSRFESLFQNKAL